MPRAVIIGGLISTALLLLGFYFHKQGRKYLSVAFFTAAAIFLILLVLSFSGIIAG